VSTETSNQTSEEIRWAAVIVCVLLGSVLVGAAFVTEAALAWRGLTPAALLEFGAAFALAALLFFFQRNFVRTIRRETRAAERRFEERATAIESRLDQLADATAARIDARYSEQDEAVRRLADNVTFDTVTAALEEANELHALAHSTALIQAARDPDGLRISFAWGVRFENMKPPVEGLTIAAELDHLQSPRPVVEVTWTPYESAASVGARFTEDLQRAGLYEGPETFDWPFAIEQLQRTLRIAIAAKRASDPEWHLHGELLELVGDDWALTEAGIECPARGYVFSHDEFPDFFERRTFQDGAFREREEFLPSPPSWVSEEEWHRLVRRGSRYFPRRSVAALMALTDWVPKRKSPTEPPPGWYQDY
jgi:hypothetical protein